MTSGDYLREQRKKESEARGKRNEASGKASHQERVETRNKEVTARNEARAKAHPKAAQDSSAAKFRRTGTGSVSDRLGSKDTVAQKVKAAQDKYVKEHPKESAAARMGKSNDIDPDAVKSYNKEPVDDDQIDGSKPAGSRNSDWDETKHPRNSKGNEAGGRFR